MVTWGMRIRPIWPTISVGCSVCHHTATDTTRSTPHNPDDEQLRGYRVENLNTSLASQGKPPAQASNGGETLFILSCCLLEGYRPGFSANYHVANVGVEADLSTEELT